MPGIPRGVSGFFMPATWLWSKCGKGSVLMKNSQPYGDVLHFSRLFRVFEPRKLSSHSRDTGVPQP